jgi:glutamate--cysteine ligase
VIRDLEQAEGYIASICFKTGPPAMVGVELEYTVHASHDPAAPVDLVGLRRALGDHAPPTVHPTGPHRSLDRGGTVTLEPGGQVEISSPPHTSLAALHAAVNADFAQLTGLLDDAGLRPGDTGIDSHRHPRMVLGTPRYDAMATSFARRNGDGRVMMCSTAGLQCCFDAGSVDRWHALHEVGPTFVAVFANSRHHAGHDTGWASARMRTWQGMDPMRTAPVPAGPDPTAAWTRYALRAPLLCVRRRDGPWDAPPGVSFGAWVRGALPFPPTYDDLDYHLSTLFPPVRPRGYLEVRYLDTQPGPAWFAPVALLAALLSGDDTIDRARELCAPAVGRWAEAARCGLADPVIATVAPALFDLAARNLDAAGLPPTLRTEVTDVLQELIR